MKKILNSLLFVFMVIMFTGCGKYQINLNDYVLIEEYGYEQFGVFKCSFDSERFLEDYKDKIKPKKAYKEYFDDEYTLADLLVEAIKIEVDANYDGALGTLERNLETNYYSGPIKMDCAASGSVFHVHIDIDDDDDEAKIIPNDICSNAEIVYSDFDYTLSDLEEPVEVDPLDYLNVTFYGKNGEGHFEISFNDDFEWAGVCNVYRRDRGDLENGQKLSVSLGISFADIHNIAETKGVRLLEGEKTFIVEGLEE